MSQIIQLIRGDDFPRFSRFVRKTNPDIHANAEEALIEAVRCDNYEMVRLLLKRGANVHARNNLALRMASREGFDRIEELLIKRGADTEILEQENDDPECEYTGRYYFGSMKLTPKKRQQILTEGLARYLVDTRDESSLPRTLRQWCERNEIELETKVRSEILKNAVRRWHEMEAEEDSDDEDDSGSESEAESEAEEEAESDSDDSEESEAEEEEEESESEAEEEPETTPPTGTTAESSESEAESASESEADNESEAEPDLPVIVPRVITVPRPPSPLQLSA